MAHCSELPKHPQKFAQAEPMAFSALLNASVLIRIWARTLILRSRAPDDSGIAAPSLIVMALYYINVITVSQSKKIT